VARTYAAILALVGMSAVLVRAFKNGNAFEAAVVSSLQWMAIFGVIGLVVGAIAQSTIDDAVRLQMERDLAGQRPKA
jgi:hypothetical protein